MTKPNLTEKGFSLLEVLIAMAILGTVAVFIMRQCGYGQTQLAASAWQDAMTLAGRNLMVELVCGLPDNAPIARLEQWGTLAPTHPDVQWTSSVRAMERFPMYRMTLLLKDASTGKELMLERYFANPEALEAR